MPGVCPPADLRPLPLPPVHGHTDHKAAYRYLVALGSNLGRRRDNCLRALQLLAEEAEVLRVSPFMVTPALASPDFPGSASQADYLNGVAELASSLTPPALYQHIVAIEDALGHNRQSKWQPRHMDIDILFWAHNDAVDFAACRPLRYQSAGPSSESLAVPHPGFWQRQFLLDLVGPEGLNIPLAALPASDDLPRQEEAQGLC